mmetsp:Transcript_37718/g.121027  ORF Transcript_37718/g.121027 Transcript_37718/m.121027 type:complete len:1181 (-) Transcript_37718:2428-5970(-)
MDDDFVEEEEPEVAVPAPEEDDDDDDEEDEEEEEEGGEEGGEQSFEEAMRGESLTKTRKKGETTKKKKGKRKRATGVARFLDDMAEESDDDEEDERPGKKVVAEDDVELRAEIRRQNERREREHIFERDADVAAVAAAIEERHKTSTSHGGRNVFVEEGDPDMTGSTRAVVRHAQAPSLTDPRLWIVGVKTGHEKEVVLSIMNKAVHRARSNAPLGIAGAAHTGTRGFVYVESKSEPAAREAIDGLPNVQRWSLKMVPVAEMVAVASAGRGLDPFNGSGSGGGGSQKKKRQSRRRLKVGAFVRMTRDRYRGDLARVVALSDGNESAIVQLVPRVGPKAGGASEKGSKSSATNRPAPRLFAASEMIAKGYDVGQRRFRFGGQANRISAAHNWHLADETFDVFENQFYRGGYLYREVNTSTMIKVEDPKPTLDELDRFVVTTQELLDGDADEEEEELDDDVDDGDDEGREAKAKKRAERKQQKVLQDQIDALARGGVVSNDRQDAGWSLDRGDRVVGTGGDELGKQYVVVSINPADGVCMCRPLNGARGDGEVVPIEASRLVKYVGVGARVKISDGRHAGQTGVVLERGELDGDHVAVVLTDAGAREITVRLAHAHESNEIAKGHDQLEGYKGHDLLQLPLGAVGVVTRIDGDALVVLTSRGETRHVQPGDVAKVLNLESARNVSLDKNDEHVREKDVVVVDHVAGGARGGGSFGGGASSKQGSLLQKGSEATVVRAYKAFLWLQPLAAASDDLALVRARHVRVAGARAGLGGGGAAGLADAYMGLGTRTVNEAQFNKDSTASSRPGRFNAKDARGQQRDPLVSKLVKVTRGNHKGLLGVVRNATATHATIELQARSQTITVKKDHVKQEMELFGRDDATATPSTVLDEKTKRLDQFEAAMGFSKMNTPFLTNATPMHNANATPMYGAGAATPLYGGGAMTPGRQTPSRAYTPAHTPSHAMTPRREGDDDDVWNPTKNFVLPPNDDDDHHLGEDESHGTGGNNTAAGTLSTTGGDNSFLRDASEGTSATTTRKATADSSGGAAAAKDEAIPAAEEDEPRLDDADLDAGGASSAELQWCMPGAEALLGDRRTCRVDAVDGDQVTVSVKNTFPTEVKQLYLKELLRLLPQLGEKVRVVDDDKTYDADLLSIEDRDGIIKDDAGEYKIIEINAIAKLAIDGYDNF